MLVDSNYAYCLSDKGFLVADITHPDSMRIISNIPMSCPSAFYKNNGYMARFQSSIFFATGDSLVEINIFNIDSPVVSNTTIVGGTITNLKIKDTLLFVPVIDSGIFVFNLNSLPLSVPSYRLNIPGNTTQIDIRDSILYIANEANGFQVVNISNINYPIVDTSLSLPATYAVTLKDTLAFVSVKIDVGLDSLYIIDITPHQTITVISKLYESCHLHHGYNILFDKNIAFMNGGRATWLVDISNLPAPRPFFEIIPEAYSIALSNGYLFTAPTLPDSFLIRAYDYSDTGTIKCVGRLYRPEFNLGLDIGAPKTILNTVIYPNPFTRNTHISYVLDNTTQVQLAVYDISGKLVIYFAHGVQSPGTYNLSWNCSNVSKGIYFMQLKTKGRTLIKKLVVM